MERKGCSLGFKFESEAQRKAYIRMINNINAIDESDQPLMGPSSAIMRKRYTELHAQGKSTILRP